MAKRAFDFREHIGLLATQFRQQIEAAVDGFAPDAEASATRRARAEEDFEFFARTYFPHYVKSGPSILHSYLFDRLPVIARSKGTRDAIAAPRGEAKSTMVSQIFVLWCVMYAKRHYPIIIMDAFEQAAEMLESIKAELEANARLQMDFPSIAKRTHVWRVGCILTANNIKIEAFGSTKRIRGRRHGPFRPDLAILDDVENDDNVRQLTQRDKLESFIKKGVIPLGGADDSISVLMIGTVLHIDSVLARFLNNRLWRSRRFKAVLQMPDRMDLWEQWEEILLNHPGDPDEAEATAHVFYVEHREEMDRGAKVSWPAMRSLESLMLRRARDGHAAFDSELQNDPGAENPFFDKITFWVNKLADWVFYGACDPSLGKKGRGRDPSGILVGGFRRETRTLDVVEASIIKRLPTKIISDIIGFQREYGCVMWAVEAVQFQEFLRTQLIAASIDAGVPVPARGVTPSAEKNLRIESLQPFFENGNIRLHPSQTTLLSQLKHYPEADHDDGPDGLHMLWMLAATGGAAAGATVEDKSSTSRNAGRTRGSMHGRRERMNA